MLNYVGHKIGAFSMWACLMLLENCEYYGKPFDAALKYFTWAQQLIGPGKETDNFVDRVRVLLGSPSI